MLEWVYSQARQELEDREILRAEERQRLLDTSPLKLAVLEALREKGEEYKHGQTI